MTAPGLDWTMRPYRPGDEARPVVDYRVQRARRQYTSLGYVAYRRDQGAARTAGYILDLFAAPGTGITTGALLAAGDFDIV